MSEQFEILVNGEPVLVARDRSLSALILDWRFDPRRVAVERNRQIVPRSAYEQTYCEPGDRIELVQFVGGG